VFSRCSRPSLHRLFLSHLVFASWLDSAKVLLILCRVTGSPPRTFLCYCLAMSLRLVSSLCTPVSFFSPSRPQNTRCVVLFPPSGIAFLYELFPTVCFFPGLFLRSRPLTFFFGRCGSLIFFSYDLSNPHPGYCGRDDISLLLGQAPLEVPRFCLSVGQSSSISPASPPYPPRTLQKADR